MALSFVAGTWRAIATSWAFVLALASAAAGQSLPVAEQNILVRRHCAVCHSDALRNGGLSLEHFDAARVPPSLAAVMLSKISGGLSVDTLRASHSQPEAKALVAKGMKGGAMLAAGIPPPADATMYALIEALGANIGAAREWRLSAGEAGVPDARTLTASIVREAPRDLDGQSAMYRLILTCNAATRAGEIRLSWSPVPATTTLLASVDQAPAVAYRVEGIEKMGDGSTSANPASVVLLDSTAAGALSMSLPRRTLKVTGVFADTVEFPFADLPRPVRQAVVPCFALR